MRTIHAKAVARTGQDVPKSDPRAQALLERMARVAYVLDCHREAIAKHSQHLAELQAELERLEVAP